MKLLYRDNYIEIDIEINEKINLIGGYSGSGKTYLINRLKHYVLEDADTQINNIKCNIKKENLIVFDGLELSKLQEYNNKLILIDRFDYLMSITKNTSYIKQLMEQDSNTYIVMSRNVRNVSKVSFDSMLQLKSDHTNTHMKLYTEKTLFI